MLYYSHLYLANQVLEELDFDVNVNKYLLGSIIPDAHYTCKADWHSSHPLLENLIPAYGGHADASMLIGAATHLIVDQYTYSPVWIDSLNDIFPYYLRPFMDDLAQLSFVDMHMLHRCDLDFRDITTVRSLDVVPQWLDINGFNDFRSILHGINQRATHSSVQEKIEQITGKDAPRVRKFRKYFLLLEKRFRDMKVPQDQMMDLVHGLQSIVANKTIQWVDQNSKFLLKN